MRRMIDDFLTVVQERRLKLTLHHIGFSGYRIRHDGARHEAEQRSDDKSCRECNQEQINRDLQSPAALPAALET